MDVLLAVYRRHHFFGEIERVLLPLFVGDVRIRVELAGLDALLAGERMALAQKHVRLAVEEFLEHQFAAAKDFREHFGVALREIKHANLAFAAGHVFDDLRGHRFAQREVVFFGVARFHDVRERVNDKCVMLAAHGELRQPHPLAGILFADAVQIVQNLAGVRKELLALARYRDALAAAREDGGADLLLQRLYGRRERRLAYEQPPGGLVERTEAGDAVGVAQLLECHDGIVP